MKDADKFPLKGHHIAIASKASLIDWKSNSVRDKDKLDAMALKQLQENPKAFD
jgi:hypothetical protein